MRWCIVLAPTTRFCELRELSRPLVQTCTYAEDIAQMKKKLLLLLILTYLLQHINNVSLTLRVRAPFSFFRRTRPLCCGVAP